ncbi:MAG: hypothetical protein M1814_004589 [Vezdaea aestivalis]|nr:MAG: hypothetical protein M1814_004589 [Vezdaea aestivalis]
MKLARETYRFRIENAPDFTLPLSSFTPNDQVLVPSVEIYVIYTQIQEEQFEQGHFHDWTPPPIHVSLHPHNMIDCDAFTPLTSFPLPSPAGWSNFTNARSVCATALSGGLENANAGGFCRKYTSKDTTARDQAIEEFYNVWFADELTPRPEWTWRENFAFAGNIRRYCWQRCFCSAPGPDRRRRPPGLMHNGMSLLFTGWSEETYKETELSDWLILDNRDIIRLANGALAMASGPPRSAAQRASTIQHQPGNLIPISPPGGWTRLGASQCVVDDIDYCEQKPWPTELFAPKLSKEDELAAGGEEKEVRREDQEKINRFSRLSQQEGAIQEELKTKLKDKEDLEEISNELELADEEDLIPYKIGDSFVKLPLPEVQELLGSGTTAIDEEVNGLEELLEKIQDEMRDLKVSLYARFGKSINLEA